MASTRRTSRLTARYSLISRFTIPKVSALSPNRRRPVWRKAGSALRPLDELVATAASEIDAAGDLAALDAVRVAYLGKKGELTARLKSLSELSAEERPR